MQNVTSTPSEDGPTDVDRFVERFAMLLAEGGVSRMAARVFGALIVAEDGKRTAGELADVLRVSPAAISGAVRYLVQVGLITRRRDPGERRDHYEVSDDLWYEAYAHRDKQLEAWVQVMAEGAAALGTGTKAGARLEDSRRFFEFLREQLPELMRKWRDYQAGHPG